MKMDDVSIRGTTFCVWCRNDFFLRGECTIENFNLERKMKIRGQGELSFSSIISVRGVQEAVSELKCIIESAMKRSI